MTNHHKTTLRDETKWFLRHDHTVLIWDYI